jgi:hypothetical protein
LNGAAFACFVQSGLNAICGTLRLFAHFEAMSSAPLGEPPCSSTMSGCFAWTLSSRSQISRWSLKSSPPVRAIFGPAGSSTSVSARRLAARKSRLSIIAEVSARWFTRDPERGRHADPVSTSKRSAAWSRKSSMLLRRSISVMPSAISRSSSTDRTSEPFCSR